VADEVQTVVDAAVEAVNVANVKTVAEMSAWTTAQSMKDHVAHSKRLDIMAESYLARTLGNADSIDPEQAVATLKLLTGNDQAQALATLGASIANLQQLMKGAQTTPPATAGA